MAERYLTVRDVAEQLGVSEPTVRSWLRERRIRGFIPGGPRSGYRIRESELERFIAELEREQATVHDDVQ